MSSAKELPAAAAQKDHELESSNERATERLAKHRWHWTLDESNPDRVSFTAYGRAVGRAPHTISVMATGYAEVLASRSSNDASSIDLETAIGKARMSASTAAAAEAVATARGKSVRSVQDTRSPHHTEVRRVRDRAVERATERGTSVAEEAQRIAADLVKTEQSETMRREERAQNVPLRFMEIEDELRKAQRHLVAATKIMPDVAFGDDELGLLSDAIGNIRAILGLVDSYLSGDSGTDWDAELARLAGKVNSDE